MSALKKKRTFWLLLLTAIFLFVAISWFCFWLFYSRFHVQTDDSYVHGNEVMLTPEVGSSVISIWADDTMFVKEGQTVVTLDPTDYQMVLEEKKADLAVAVRKVVSLFDAVPAKKAEVLMKEAELTQFELDFLHREGLIGSKAVSLEEFEQAQTNVKSAAAALELSLAELAQAKSLVSGTTIATHPFVQREKAAVRDAYINLRRCIIVAPVTGYVAKRRVQVGDRVMVGETLLNIVPLDYLWVEANYKETQLNKARIGQKVALYSDLHGRSIKYEGEVVGLSAGTGSAFALLPAQNASGNWIKIIQRLPVRIEISKESLRENPLMIGLSMHANINVSDTSGKMLSLVPRAKPIYKTSVFDWSYDLSVIDSEIEKIIKDNDVREQT